MRLMVIRAIQPPSLAGHLPVIQRLVNSETLAGVVVTGVDVVVVAAASGIIHILNLLRGGNSPQKVPRAPRWAPFVEITLNSENVRFVVYQIYSFEFDGVSETLNIGGQSRPRYSGFGGLSSLVLLGRWQYSLLLEWWQMRVLPLSQVPACVVGEEAADKPLAYFSTGTARASH